MAGPEQEDRKAAEGPERRPQFGRSHPLLRCEVLRGGPLQAHRRDHKVSKLNLSAVQLTSFDTPT